MEVNAVEATQEKQKEWKDMTDDDIQRECRIICGVLRNINASKEELEQSAKDAILKRFGRSAAVCFGSNRHPIMGRQFMGTIWSPRGDTINF